MRILGIDTGGTFTDLVYFDGQQLSTHKELSTPHAPEQAILKGIAALGIDCKELHIVHGTTVATNALLEAKGARTVFITNHGFKDLLLIGRQTRKELYNLTPKKQRSLFDPQLNLEVGGRMSPRAEIVEPLTDEELKSLEDTVNKLKPKAIAICLLFSFVDDQFERKILQIFKDKYFVSISSQVLAEHREYERSIATWVNSYLGPIMQGYLSRLGNLLPTAQLSIMQSHGLTLDTHTAGNNAVRLLLSGPAGGLWGSLQIAQGAGYTQLLTFDMGGTSTDVSIINGEFNLTQEAKIAELPIVVPMLDIHTIGAGGGSIAWIDEGGLLQVGPHSAGADPGPACYAKGGTQPTVTDANLVLGRLPASCKLAGSMRLDHEAAIQVIEALADELDMDVMTCAEGIIRVANEQMVQALRVMSVHRGHDPKQFVLVSFGGAGGLHVCELADALELPYALIPQHAGILSAFGLLVAPPGKEISRSYIKLLDACENETIEKIFVGLEEKILQELQSHNIQFKLKRELDLRYQGQSSCLKVNWLNCAQAAQEFHNQHKERYGYALEIPVELVNLRVTASGERTHIKIQNPQAQTDDQVLDYVKLYTQEAKVPVYARENLNQNQVLKGPAIISEKDATTYVAPDWQATQLESGGVLLERVDKD